MWDPGRGGRLTREGNVLTIRLIRIVVQKKRASQAVLVVKNWPANAGDIRDVSLIQGLEDPLAEDMTAHLSILAWRISWTEEPGGLHFMGSKKTRT